ncbi:MAG: hypothetical protein JWO95_1899, partial [Verrucomicrobiales bacterium]|nr:hypothetical protein [Verrucomicrobiales bacterium]
MGMKRFSQCSGQLTFSARRAMLRNECPFLNSIRPILILLISTARFFHPGVILSVWVAVVIAEQLAQRVAQRLCTFVG